MKIIRDWCVNSKITDVSTPGANKIYLSYFDCWTFIYDSLIRKGYSNKQTEDIQFIALVKKLVKEKVKKSGDAEQLL